MFSTKLGQVKKTSFSEYDKSRREGFIAINLRDGDELVRVVETHGDDDVFLVTQSGMTIRFSEQDVRPWAATPPACGECVWKAGDRVVSCDVARDEADILSVTDAGYGKRTKLDKFNRQARGGQGVRGIRLTAKRGRVVAAFMAGLEDEILLDLDLGRGDPHRGAGDRLAGAGRHRRAGDEPRRGRRGGRGGRGGRRSGG